MSARVVRTAALVAATLTLLLAAAIAWNVGVWIDRPFPGFLVLRNRVVPSIALPDWTEGPPSRFFQQEILAVDGVPVRDAEDVYARVARAPIGTSFRYTLRAPNGDETTATVPSRVFRRRDVAFLFGAFAVLGLAFLATGVWVAVVAPANPASLGLLSSGVATALFAITAIDLYGPAWFFRLHVIGEAWCAAGFLHLATVFPTDRFGPWRRRIVGGIYGGLALLVLAYELALPIAPAYTRLHLAASAAGGIAMALLIVAVAWDWATTPSLLVRRRIRVAALGTAAAFLAPAVTMAASALFGGKVAVNVGVLTAGIFPISVGYAIVQQDLFEIDVLLRRATTYVIVVALVAAGYLVLLACGQMIMPVGMHAGGSPLTPVLNLALIFVIAPLQRRVQQAVDRLFFRSGYDSELALADLSRTLASAHTVDDVVRAAHATLAATVTPTGSWIFAGDAAAGAFRCVEPTPLAPTIALSPALARRAAEGRILTRYECQDAAAWVAPDADLLVPIRCGGPPIALLALGPRASGRAYRLLDDAFLRAAASQIALALTSAQAFAELADLNARLEQQVRDRTAALQTANGELEHSLADLRGAYDRLERNQASLLRADRLATLGRLAAGIAHEVNTPLGAVHNSLRVATDLAREYQDSIDDPTVTPADHQAIARELLDAVEAASTWARKASHFIAKVKLHSREAPALAPTAFSVADVVQETEALLAHRVRTSTCRLAIAVDGEPTVCGDRTRLGQVLVNLIGNALDAYEDRGIVDGVVDVDVARTGSAVVCTVADRAGGIPPHVLPHIFDELFTTKEPGRGTGLGLWIARQLVEETFGGTLQVQTEDGVGTCFTVTLPTERSAPAVERPAA